MNWQYDTQISVAVMLADGHDQRINAAAGRVF
jgi:hypothetical protein